MLSSTVLPFTISRSWQILYKVLDSQNKKDKTVRVQNKLKLLSILYKGSMNTVLCFILPIDKWHCQKGLK